MHLVQALTSTESDEVEHHLRAAWKNRKADHRRHYKSAPSVEKSDCLSGFDNTGAANNI